jgi:hypothetical protein
VSECFGDFGPLTEAIRGRFRQGDADPHREHKLGAGGCRPRLGMKSFSWRPLIFLVRSDTVP